MHPKYREWMSPPWYAILNSPAIRITSGIHQGHRKSVYSDCAVVSITSNTTEKYATNSIYPGVEILKISHNAHRSRSSNITPPKTLAKVDEGRQEIAALYPPRAQSSGFFARFSSDTGNVFWQGFPSPKIYSAEKCYTCKITQNAGKNESNSWGVSRCCLISYMKGSHIIWSLPNKPNTYLLLL